MRSSTDREVLVKSEFTRTRCIHVTSLIEQSFIMLALTIFSGLWLVTTVADKELKNESPSRLHPSYRTKRSINEDLRNSPDLVFFCLFGVSCAALLDESNGNYRWRRQDTPQTSRNTGPRQIKEGCMYADSSYGNPHNTAVLFSADIEAKADRYCCIFNYSMHGADVGSLKVISLDANTRRATSTLFTKSGDQGSDWQRINVPVPTKTNEWFVLKFEATRGSGRLGDIAIDDVFLIKGLCPGRRQGSWGAWQGWECSVTCGSGLERRRRNCQTQSCTVQDEEKRPCTKGSCPRSRDERGKGWSPWDECAKLPDGHCSKHRICQTPAGCDGSFFDTAPCECPGSCSVTCGVGVEGEKCQTSPCPGSSEETRICRKETCPIAGNWGEWLSWDCSCDNDVGRRRRMCQGGSCTGPNEETRTCRRPPCSLKVFSCSFDEECPWFPEESKGAYKWNRVARSTRNEGTGSNMIDGGYLRVDATLGSENDNAVIKSGDIELETDVTCLSFIYHMHGDDIGRLNVTTFHEEDGTNLVFNKFGNQGEKWYGFKGTLIVNPVNYFNIYITATRGQGQQGDISIDDLMLVKGPCDGEWSTWSQWTCSVTCGRGTKTRHRTCNGDNCPGHDRETSPCNLRQCPNWRTWSQWTCSVTCGSGTRRRYRTCSGDGCPGPDRETQSCYPRQCPGWSTWSQWSCSVTCGIGTRSRNRTCSGDGCPGPNRETQSCYPRQCPAWSTWSQWTCDVTCGSGTRSRNRKCSGERCLGHDRETEGCTISACQEWAPWDECVQTHDGCRRHRRCLKSGSCGGSSFETATCVCSEWTFWSTCSVTCGGGTRNRIRNCQDSCNEQQEEPCNLKPCTDTSTWGPWGSWSCYVTCGQGSRYRNRSCSGDYCRGSARQRKLCVTDPEYCPGKWEPWHSWQCTVTCGSGTKRRKRICPGGSCSGPEEEMGICIRSPCDPDPWSDWSLCSVTCGQGIQQRKRLCRGSCSSDPTDVKQCRLEACPNSNSWGPWGSWLCDVTCGIGIAIKRRRCQGTSCEGEDEDRRLCSLSACNEWSPWTKWGDCSATCGNGKQTRIRACSGCTGDRTETKSCFIRSCW